MAEAGQALLGIGMGVGDRRAMDAVEHAIESPLLETSLEGARSILLSITGGRDLSLWEVNEAAKAVAEAAHPDANIIFGAMVDEKIEDQVWVTVVATGYGDRPQSPGRAPGDRESAHPGRRRAARAARASHRERPSDVRHARRRGRARVRAPPLASLRPMKGVVAAGHPVTARGRRRRAARRRQRGRRRRGVRADVVRGRVAAHRPGRRGLHAGAHRRRGEPPARLLRRGAGLGLDERRAGRADADRRPVLRGGGAALQRGPVLLRRLRHHASGWPRRCSASAPCRSPTLTAGPAQAAREGVEVVPMQAFLFRVLEPILRSTPEAAAIYAPGERLLRGGGDASACPSWATSWSASAPRARTSSTPATWPPR